VNGSLDLIIYPCTETALDLVFAINIIRGLDKQCLVWKVRQMTPYVGLWISTQYRESAAGGGLCREIDEFHHSRTWILGRRWIPPFEDLNLRQNVGYQTTNDHEFTIVFCNLGFRIPLLIMWDLNTRVCCLDSLIISTFSRAIINLFSIDRLKNYFFKIILLY
jgi:hypothetical protein